MNAVRRYAKALIGFATLATSTSVQQALPHPYNLWAAVGAGVLGLLTLVRVPNATAWSLESDVAKIAAEIRAATATQGSDPLPAVPAPPSSPPSALDVALAILTPPEASK